MQKDYYQILAVIDSAEDAVIKAAYKALIQIYHPDRYAGDKHEANQKTKDILEAYRVLSDPDLRAEYNKTRVKTTTSQTDAPPSSTPARTGKIPVFDFQSNALPLAGSSQSKHFSEMPETILRKWAKDNKLEAQLELGKRCFNGSDGNQSFTEAFIWFKKAAEQDDSNAQTVLGFMYANGIGIDDNAIKAFIWFRKAAEQGNPDAQFRLGLCFYAGFGVLQNHTEALFWLNQAEQQNNSNAQYLIGFMYANGEGVEQDQNLAITWFRKAALLGNQSAKDELSLLNRQSVKI